MKNSIYMALWLLLTPLVSLPMGFLTNNSLTKNLAFLSRMRLTRPITTTETSTLLKRPYFSKSINFLENDLLQKTVKEKGWATSKIVALNKTSDLTFQEKENSTKKLLDYFSTMTTKEENLKKDIESFKKLNDDFNTTNNEYKKAIENNDIKSLANYLTELNKKIAIVNEFKKGLIEKYEPKIEITKKNYKGEPYKEYASYKFDEE